MTRSGLRACVAALMFSIPIVSHSQQCSVLVKDGVFDVTNQNIDSSSATAYMSWYCQKQFGSEEEAENYSADGTVPFKGLAVKLGFQASSDSWSRWYSETCASSRYTFETQQKVVIHIATVSQSLANAFNACINSTGLHAWLERGGNESSFVIATRYVPGGPIATVALNQFAVAGGVKCQPNVSPASAATQRTLCERTDKNGGTIVVASPDANVVEGGTIAIKKVVEYPLPAPPPPPGPWTSFQITASTNPNWRTQIVNWLAVVRPRIGNLYASISGGNDFYIWARNDGDGPASGYQVLNQPVSGNSSWLQQFSSTMGSGKVIPIGFNAGSANIWYIQYP